MVSSNPLSLVSILLLGLTHTTLARVRAIAAWSNSTHVEQALLGRELFARQDCSEYVNSGQCRKDRTVTLLATASDDQ